MISRAGLLALLLTATPTIGAELAPSSCLICHQDAELVEPDSLAIVGDFAADVHAAVGLSCHDCHGGNPDPALAGDPYAAMDDTFAPRPYLGTPARQDIPRFCGRCHSDATYMRRFGPELRIDQEEQYWISNHGRALRAGNRQVATCIDCHGVHGILEVGDPRAPVYPTHVADTCGGCHADAERMSGFRLADGRPLPVDQVALWRQSVHAASLLEREDLSAPTCNDCHGNHGAAPPGVDTISQVCGSCHGREAELLRASAKHRLLADHNDYLADVGDEGCVACHEDPEPQVRLTGVHRFGECASCHGHHGVVRATVAMLSPLPETPCAFCHESSGELGEQFPEPAAPSRHFVAMRQSLIASAPPGMTADALYDWLVDQALALPTHTTIDSRGDLTLRPEFARLFSKFRIGKTHYSYTDPLSGESVEATVRRCSDCHASEPVLGEPRGAEVAASLLRQMWELTSLTARAERIHLAARRGGVETRQAAAAIDRAVDAQIELETLVHAFAVDEGSAFANKQAAGLEAAGEALAAGRSAIAELGSRRRGLGFALLFVVLVLVALALKIRSLPADTGAPSEPVD